MADPRIKQANDSLEDHHRAPMTAADAVRHTQKLLGQSRRFDLNRKGPICERCCDLGLIYMLDSVDVHKPYWLTRPCMDCPRGLALHGLPGKACLVAKRLQRDCPYCGAVYEENEKLPPGLVPHDFAGEADLTPEVLARSIPVRDKIQRLFQAPGYVSPFAVRT